MASVLRPVFRQWAQEEGVPADFTTFLRNLPWHEEHYRMFSLRQRHHVVGYMDALPLQIHVPPYRLGTVNYLYVLLEHRTQAWRLMRAGLKYAKQLGIEQVMVTSDFKTQLFWQAHGFTPMAMQLIRRF